MKIHRPLPHVVYKIIDFHLLSLNFHIFSVDVDSLSKSDALKRVMEFIYSFISDGMDQRPAYGYSHRLRAAVEKPNDTPSPLDYFPEEISHGRSRGFSFGHRPRISYAKKDDDTPGPGEYFIEKEIPVPRPRNSAWTFGMKPRQRKSRSQTPGPKYNTAIYDQSNKGFSFGSAKRPQAFSPRNFDLPGPGEYETKRCHSNVKGYSFGLRVSDFSLN